MAISAASDQDRRRSASEDWKACALPWKVVGERQRLAEVAFRRGWIGVDRSPSATPGFRLNDSVADGNWP